MSKKIKRNHRHRTHTKRDGMSISRKVIRASEITLGIIIGPIKRPKLESEPEIREREYSRARSGAYYRVDPITVASARYHVTHKPTLDVNRSLMTSNSENRAYLWAHLKLKQSLATGSPIETLYVWDIASPSITISPIAKFTLNRETRTVERT